MKTKKIDISVLVFMLVMMCVLTSVQMNVNAEEDLGRWVTKASMPTARKHLGVAAINKKIYVIGGVSGILSNNVEEYTPPQTIQISTSKIGKVSNTSIQALWTSSGEINGATYSLGVFDENDNQVKENLWTSSLNDTIIGLNTSTIYNLKVKAKNSYGNITDWYEIGSATTLAEQNIGKWTTKASMQTVRYGIGTVEANDKIYSIGGFTSSSSYSNILEEYNPIINQWTTKANMPTARRFLGVTQAKDKIYAIGGATANGLTNKVEEYNITTNQWTKKSNMSTSRNFLGVAQVNNKIYAIGGYTPNGICNTVEVYDVETEIWTTKIDMPTPRYGLGVEIVNNKIYAIGGYTASGRTSIVEVYDIETGLWTTKAKMPTSRYSFGTAVINNDIYAIGGSIDTGSTDIVEKYNPIANEWETVESMITSRYHLGTAEANNRIYAIGGYSSSNGYLNKVEQYIPSQAQNINIDIESSSYEVQYGTEFDVYVTIDGATNINTEDITIIYDSKLFVLEDTQVINQEIYLKDQEAKGHARYIMGSKGRNNVINETTQLLKLTFNTIELEGAGEIAVSIGLVADEEGTIIIPKCSGKIYTIGPTVADVNRDGKINLADMAITLSLYNTDLTQWGTSYPDTNQNGIVEDLDLLAIAESTTSVDGIEDNVSTMIIASNTKDSSNTNDTTPCEAVYDKTAPTILNAEISKDNTYIDITFNEGIYGMNDGTTVLTADKLAIKAIQKDGSISKDVAINTIKQNNNTKQQSASELIGGETTIRVFLNIEKHDKIEAIEITPLDEESIYDMISNAMKSSDTTGIKELNKFKINDK